MRLGVDIGGTKIALAVLDAGGRELFRHRIPTPHGDYESARDVLAEQILRIEKDMRAPLQVGIGMPGLVAPDTGVVANAYNTPYNGKPLKPEVVTVVRALPKTRSGKVMRRVIRAAWLGLDAGDLSALDDPASVEAIRAVSLTR